MTVPNLTSLFDIIYLYSSNLLEYIKQIALALFPMLLTFALFQFSKKTRLRKKKY